LELIPQTVSSKNHFKAPWINAHIKQISNRKKRAYNRAHSTGLPSHRSKYRYLKKLSQQECRKAQNQYVRQLVSPGNDYNHKCLWSYIKSRRQENIVKDDRGTYKESVDKANVFKKYFSTVFTKENTDNLPTLDGPPYRLIDDLNVTKNGIVSLLQDLEVHKACGPDGIFPHLLKETALNIQ